VAGIAAYHVTLGGVSVGRNPLITRFLYGTLRLRPVIYTRVPAWDLAVVQEGLSAAPFEPFHAVPEKFLTLKTVFILAISSLQRVGYLQALWVPTTCLEFAQGMVKPFLFPKTGYFPKVRPTYHGRHFAGILSSFQNHVQQNLNLFCPVRALDTYVHRAALWRKPDQLFVCFGSPKKGLPVSKQTFSKWIVETIFLAY